MFSKNQIISLTVAKGQKYYFTAPRLSTRRLIYLLSYALFVIDELMVI